MKHNAIPKIDTFIAASVRAVRDGTASQHQQQEFYKFVLLDLGMLTTDAYCDSERDTAFCCGRQWVARRIVDACEVPMEALAKRDMPPLPEKTKRKRK